MFDLNDFQNILRNAVCSYAKMADGKIVANATLNTGFIYDMSYCNITVKGKTRDRLRNRIYDSISSSLYHTSNEKLREYLKSPELPYDFISFENDCLNIANKKFKHIGISDKFDTTSVSTDGTHWINLRQQISIQGLNSNSYHLVYNQDDWYLGLRKNKYYIGHKCLDKRYSYPSVAGSMGAIKNLGCTHCYSSIIFCNYCSEVVPHDMSIMYALQKPDSNEITT